MLLRSCCDTIGVPFPVRYRQANESREGDGEEVAECTTEVPYEIALALLEDMEFAEGLGLQGEL